MLSAEKMSRLRQQLSLYLVLGPENLRHHSLTDTVQQAIQGGVTMVQLRDKSASDADFVTLAHALREICQPKGIPLILNDRPHLVTCCNADGAHIGQSDGDPMQARKLIGADKYLGLSITHEDQVASIPHDAVDHIGLGPIFGAGVKQDADPELGLQRAATIAAQLTLPVVGIGAIDQTNAASLITNGLDGAAVVSAITYATSPLASTKQLRRSIDDALQQRQLSQ